MKKKEEHLHDGKSLKTLFIYAALVTLLIVASLTWKAFLIFQQSKFNNQHFTLTLAQNEKVKEIVVFDPADESMSIIWLKDAKIVLKDLARQTGISTDGHINSNNSSSDVIKENVSETLFSLALQYPSLQKDITIIDAFRLSFYAKNLPPNKLVIKEVTSSELMEDSLLRKTLISFFSDDTIATENVSIQVINATGISGIGQRLERILLLKGANVVSVITAPKLVQQSTIRYFGQETYTLQKIVALLGYESEKLHNETIADIVITIGEDNKNTIIY